VKDLEFLSFLDQKIKRVEQRMLSDADRYHPDLRAAVEHIISSGGKRIRPKVALLVGNIFSSDETELTSLCAAIEMLHTATLVHDDLIDGALLRRGIPTLNSDWSPAATVLTGDYIFARAALLAADVGSADVTCLFAETLITIVNGEITQLFNRNHSSDLDSYYQRIYEKTGSMFVLASKASAILGTATDQQVNSAEEFGKEIGNAFQIVDDILDFSGDETRVGKPVGNDLRQGVITLPALYFLDQYPDDPDMQAVLSGSQDQKKIEKLVEKVIDSGCVKQAHEAALLSAEKANRHLEDFPESPERASLNKLTGYIVDRDF
jgi:geranylgeranyl pyrophosphate synthase